MDQPTQDQRAAGAAIEFLGRVNIPAADVNTQAAAGAAMTLLGDIHSGKRVLLTPDEVKALGKKAKK